MILLALGVIIGLLVNPAKERLGRHLAQTPYWQKVAGNQAQFIEPVSAKERFDNAKNVSDLLNS